MHDSDIFTYLLLTLLHFNICHFLNLVVFSQCAIFFSNSYTHVVKFVEMFFVFEFFYRDGREEREMSC